MIFILLLSVNAATSLFGPGWLLDRMNTCRQAVVLLVDIFSYLVCLC